jgi:molybdopterin synthase sulfur carrier subunit
VATVHLPRSLVTLFPEPPPRRLDVDAGSLAELIDRLDDRWPGMRDRLCDPGPTIREHINVFVDGARQRELAFRLTGASVVHIIPAVAGGAAGGRLGAPGATPASEGT